MEQYPFVYGAMGVHPDSVKNLTEERFAWMKKQLDTNKKLVAVGEIGLDYYWDESPRDIQKDWFVRQMDLARQTNRPIIIHSRDAAQDTFDIMEAEHAEKIGGVVHCFSYAVELARKTLDWDFFIGVGGVVTFNNGRKLKEVVEYAPLDHIVLETDCPYLSPVPHRGKRNDSRNLPLVVAQIAQIKQISPEEVIEATYRNARRLYRMDTWKKE